MTKPTLPFLLLLLLRLTQASTRGGLPKYMNFTFDATEFPSEAEYDYIIVGGGTAGCPLAATLSSRHHVLVLERGGSPHEYPNLQTQEGFLRTLSETDAQDSPAESFTSEDGVPNARGRVLGGSSSINAGFYSRADPEFYVSGSPGVKWEMGLVNRSFEWVEKVVAFRPVIKNWQSAVRDALLEADVTPYNGFTFDHAVGTKIGGSTFDEDGQRHTAADLLGFAHAENIRVALRATAERVLFNAVDGNDYGIDGLNSKKPKAIGVIYRDRAGRIHHAMTRSPNGEVVLSAGALGSPQLLLLSGIGPRPYLSSQGIPVVHHNPYVGELLSDNPRNGVSILSPTPLDHSLIQVVGITGSATYIEAASNIVPFTQLFPSAFLRPLSAPVYLPVATLIEKIANPLSVGSLRLDPMDPMSGPRVRFNYFSSSTDLARCVAGVRKVGEVLLLGRSMDEFKFENWPMERGGPKDFRYVGPALPGNMSDDGVVEEFCRSTKSTIWHYHGGCVAGRVVDGEYRVMGVDGLRVVDGSVLLRSPGTNPQATLMMMGRYVGQRLIREGRSRRIRDDW
ncbi:(R)-mandelonitrile lyase-like [Acorus calamus]|uniref:(R)-mandelonitrile lyase-like n=1 Tax=Acorus calamus TaxID=4465 RepID=A0AAV9CR22_ACOCL|nr:(R)-mandelonitrile lyase-like [Acorus calamus]